MDDMRLRLISAKSGTSAVSGRTWHSIAGTVELAGPGGLAAEVIVGAFVSETQRAGCAQLIEEHGAGNVVLHIQNPRCQSSRSSKKDETSGKNIWRTNHSLIGGKIASYSVEPRAYGLQGELEIQPADEIHAPAEQEHAEAL